jgi:hypothetical protein
MRGTSTWQCPRLWLPFFGSDQSTTMNFHLLSLLLPIAALAAAAVHDTRDTGVGRRVRTTSGFVTGHPAPNAPKVSEYLGIPFAKPPVGELRFASPVAYVSHGTLDASNYVSYQNTPSYYGKQRIAGINMLTVRATQSP